MRRIVMLGFLVLVAGISFFAGAFYDALKLSEAQHVPLTDHLPADFQQASDAFNARIQSTFPVGSPLAGMAGTLKSQGFAKGDWSDAEQDEHFAVRKEDNFACNIQAIVVWRQDQSGKLTQIRGQYGQAGCL